MKYDITLTIGHDIDGSEKQHTTADIIKMIPDALDIEFYTAFECN